MLVVELEVQVRARRVVELKVQVRVPALSFLFGLFHVKYIWDLYTFSLSGMEPDLYMGCHGRGPHPWHPIYRDELYLDYSPGR